MASLGAGLALVLAAVALGGSPAAADEDGGGAGPGDVRVTDLQDTQFTVEWDPVESTSYYHAKLYRPGAGQHFKSTLVHQDNQPATFTGLTWGTEYVVVVTAVNTQHNPVYRDSEPLEVTTALPDGCSLPSEPLNLRPVLDDQDRVETITWDESAEGCGDLSYQLHADGVGTVWSKGMSADVHFMLFVHEVLEPGETYTFRATASDIRGNVSPPSDPVTLTMPTEIPRKELTPPSDLRVVVDDDGFVDVLEWDAATGGTGSFTYNFNYRFGTDPEWLGFSFFFATEDLFADLEARQIGSFVDCTPQHHPSMQMIVRITALSGGEESAPSNEVAICFA